MNPIRLLAMAAVTLCTCGTLADDRPGHSVHGSAFDTGLRQRPWRMEGIGKTVVDCS